ncbi:MAG: PRC-barrel domain-containing protein [Nitrospirae bacterium]|nr:PRC-barrel domain-containing protein [Nitrospirota bacterium]
MRKLKTIIVINMIVLGLVLTGAFAADMMRSERSATTQWASNLIGTTVKNLQGDNLGKITDLTISDNRVTFAVISHGGVLGIGDKLIPVPINALTIVDNKNAVLDISKEKLATAPNFEKNAKKYPDFSSREYTEDTYRFYGVQPFWKEGSMEHMMEKEKSKY